MTIKVCEDLARKILKKLSSDSVKDHDELYQWIHRVYKSGYQKGLDSNRRSKLPATPIPQSEE